MHAAAAVEGKGSSRRRQMQALKDAMEQEATMQLSDVQDQTVGSLQKRLAGGCCFYAGSSKTR